jgi:CBS domain containing-hemolysin-like protein
MKSKFPLPVVDDDGDLQGVLSREDLAEVLSGFNRVETDGETQIENNDK